MKGIVFNRLYFIPLLIFLVLLSACNKEETESEEVITLSFANELPASHPWGISAEKFKETVEEESNGSIEIVIHNGGSLGSSGYEILEGTGLGTIDIGIASTPVSQMLPEFELLSLPYLFKNREDAWEVVDSEVGTEIMKGFEEQNLKHLAFWEDGYRQVTNNSRQIYTPEDFEGLRIRVPESTLRMDTFEALGSSPLPMSFSEVFTALQQGTIDGQENPLSVIENSSLYDVQKYLTITNHVYSPASLFINNEVWNELTNEQQDILIDAANEGRDLNRELNKEEGESLAMELEEKGMEVYTLSEEEMEVFQETTLPVYEKLVDELGGNSDEILKSILERE
ncbi:DctP family TRAP transporter solute-binding subunit [Jeotgalicoccus sp. S0W5]|uniref:DctP family TRAP transporter solute-binding subunit n=1 Tax=Jeotgalicoccus sp. S0W5 TaxID=2527874 RepID=UPI0014151F29|nr:DctP family TRAP transporter solute-binding subunit [Jeotgalicoccus sp. S0W5]